VGARSVNGLLDMVELEAANFSRCVGQAKRANCASTIISWLSAAIESAFACVELAGRLRDYEPDAADQLASRWRDAAADLSVRRHEVVENARAELAGKV
jgi:hypothetical protein